MTTKTANDRYIKCPWCGYEDRDTWEYGMKDDETAVVECENCEAPMCVTCSISVTYHSEKDYTGNSTR